MHESISTESAAKLVEWLQEMMTTSYGGLFTSRVASTAALERWERLWALTLVGKNTYRTKRAFGTLFGLYTQVFGPADFNRVYRETPDESNGRKALPKPRSNKERALAALKEAKANMNQISDGTGVRRTRANVESGDWTPEMERRFRKHAAVVEYPL